MGRQVQVIFPVSHGLQPGTTFLKRITEAFIIKMSLQLRHRKSAENRIKKTMQKYTFLANQILY